MFDTSAIRRLLEQLDLPHASLTWSICDVLILSDVHGCDVSCAERVPFYGQGSLETLTH